MPSRPIHTTGTAAALAVVAIASLPTMARAQQCEDLVLGAALSATGIYASNGTNTKNGYDFAVKKVNEAGGIKIGGKCYHLTIKYYDDESTPARAAQLVERLINQDNIKFVLGPYSSPMTKAVLPITEKYQISVVQAEAASRSLFTQGYKYHFGIIATSEKYLTPVIEMAAEHAKQAGRDPSSVKVAMIYQDDPFSLDVRQGVADEIKKLHMKTVIDDRMPKDLNDITTFLTKVKALKPDVLVVSGHEKGAATATRQMGEHKIEVPLVGMTHCESAKIVNDFPNAPEGLVYPAEWDETMKGTDPLFGSPAEYNKIMQSTYNYTVVPYHTAEASCGVEVWADALQRAQSLDSEKVREALTKTDMKTMCGGVKFAADGSNPGKDMVLRQIDGGKYKVVYPSELAAASLTYPRQANY